MIPPRLHAVAVAVAAALVLLTNLGGPALWDEDEPKNAACSLAMLERGDWVVPTFNGRLRVEKPALVNWLHLAGFALAGRTETGARLGSAILTTITCLVVCQIARHGCGAPAGLVAGLAMATCVWTAVGGRSATPDAPLVFFTTLSLWCFVMGHRRAGGLLGPGWRSWRGACGCGGALGCAVLAKGPLGLIMPLLAFTIFALWQAWDDQASPIPRIPRLWRAVVGLRLPLIAGTATAVALPWYVAVTIRTGGAWLEGFLLVHNVGRFQAPMEGHDGSAFVYYPAVLAIGFFPWSIVLAAAIVHAAVIVGTAPTSSPGPDATPRRDAIRLMICWLATWVIAFSSAGTKLPGYIWPAYPALAVITGDLLASWAAGEAICTRWCRLPDRALEGVMRLAWSILFLAGLGIGIALMLAASTGIPALAILAPIGLIPMAAAAAAWILQSQGRRQASLGALAVSACLVVTLLAAVGSDVVGGARAARRLVDSLGARPAAGAWAGFGSVPPSVVFYAADTIPQLHSTEAVSEHLGARPDAHLLVDARFQMNLPSPLPPGYGVIAREQPLFGPGLLVIGPRAAAVDPPHAPSSEPPLAWLPPAPPR